MPSGSKMRSRKNFSRGIWAARATRIPRISAPVLYIHRSPGWCMSGSVAKRRIHSSGDGGTAGFGGPKAPSFNSSAARWMGVASGGPQMMPNPGRNVSRSRTVIARAAGTVSSSGPSMRRSTRRSASSGSRRSTGSSSPILPSSRRIIAAAAVMGFVIDVIRKSVSRRIGSAPPTALVPMTPASTSPLRLTSQTSPDTSPRSTCRSRTSFSLSRRLMRSPLTLSATCQVIQSRSEIATQQPVARRTSRRVTP
jgi:hypothetical protein